MTAYPTCFGCTIERKSCAKLAAIKCAVRGLHVGSVKFRCPDKKYPFSLGDAVWVRTDAWMNAPEEDRQIDDFPGHFLRMSGTKAVCFVKDAALSKAGAKFVPNGDGHVKVSLGKLSRRDADSLPSDLCPACREPYAITNKCEGAEYPAIGCLERLAGAPRASEPVNG